jgi:hypothetical protein
MANYVTNWVAVKDSNNTKHIVVFVQFDSTVKNIETRSITDEAFNKKATASWNLTIEGTNEKVWKKANIYLSTSYDQLPADHEIAIETYVSDVKQDNESTSTGSAPTW